MIYYFFFSIHLFDLLILFKWIVVERIKVNWVDVVIVFSVLIYFVSCWSRHWIFSKRN